MAEGRCTCPSAERYGESERLWENSECTVHGMDGTTEVLIVALNKSAAHIFAGSDYEAAHFPEVQPIHRAVREALEADHG